MGSVGCEHGSAPERQECSQARDRVLPFASLTGTSDTGREAQKGVRGLARDKAAVSYLGL